MKYGNIGGLLELARRYDATHVMFADTSLPRHAVEVKVLQPAFRSADMERKLRRYFAS